MRLKLILCAFGSHYWCMYMCRSKDAENNTQRECGRCGRMQTRHSRSHSWGNVN